MDEQKLIKAVFDIANGEGEEEDNQPERATLSRAGIQAEVLSIKLAAREFMDSLDEVFQAVDANKEKHDPAIPRLYILEVNRQVKEELADLIERMETGTAQNAEDWDRIVDDLERIAAREANTLRIVDILQEFYPFLEAELKLKKYKDLTIDDICREGIDQTTGRIIEGGPFDKLVQAARIRQEKASQKKTKPKAEITPVPIEEKEWQSLPNSEIINHLERVINRTAAGRKPVGSPQRPHHKVQERKEGGVISYKQTNIKTGDSYTVNITDINGVMKKTGKTFMKMFVFSLQKMATQGFPLETGFSLQELVDLGMYDSVRSARRAVKNFYEDQKRFSIGGDITIMRGRKKEKVREMAGQLIGGYDITDSYVTLYRTTQFNLDIIAPYFTIFPRSAFVLNSNAFVLMHYICFLARQNVRAIKEKGCFFISFEAIRYQLGLPSPDEVTNRQYRQLIREPIEAAITEIEDRIIKPGAICAYDLTLTMRYPLETEKDTPIKEWLTEGKLEVGIAGEFAKPFIALADKTKDNVEKWTRAKINESAKIAARAEAKAAKEAEAE